MKQHSTATALLFGHAECRALHLGLEQAGTALRRDLPYAQAPPALRAQVMRALDEEGASDTPQPRRRAPLTWRMRPFWVGAASGLDSAALAATLAFLLLAPPFTTRVVDELLRAHVNSLLSTHLIDVVSTDRHTVKPWFAGHTDVSPVVADFATRGYKLIGGRVDYLNHQRAAVVVYEHGRHVINVFSWADSRRALPKRATVDGYHLIFW